MKKPDASLVYAENTTTRNTRPFSRMTTVGRNYNMFCSVLQPSSIRGFATPWTYFLHLSPFYRTAWMDNTKTWTGLPAKESIRMRQDRDKRIKYVHGVANPRIEDGQRTEQNIFRLSLVLTVSAIRRCCVDFGACDH